MTTFQIIAVLIALTACVSYLNHRFFRLPPTIGVMIIALIASLGLIGLGQLGWDAGLSTARSILSRIDFDATLMQGMLSFLLFAGALHINLNDLAKKKYIITSLATVGVLLSTFIVGTAMFFLLQLFGQNIAYAYCLLFGALIAPTDPIAVLGILKSANVPRSLATKISGESLFNDGVGVVLFTVIYEIAVEGHALAFGHISLLLLEEAVGGVLFGLMLGWLVYHLLKSVDNYQVEVLLTLALVMGGYTLALALHTSGPIAIVVAGLLIGNQGRHMAMSDRTREHLDTFWELIDGVLNMVLFVLIGLEVLLLSFSGVSLLIGLLAALLVLTARWVSVGVPVFILRRWRSFSPGVVRVMTWGGLRGGISVALALSIPAGAERDIILAVTYVIVLFSIVVQGSTIKRVAAKATAQVQETDDVDL